MVKRVYGTVEGAEIIFTPSSNDVWQCTVPPVPDGEYVIELYAEDEAGNRSYTATILFTVNVEHLRFDIKVMDFADSTDINGIDVCAKIPAYEINVTQCERVDCIWSMDPVEIRDFELRVVECSICEGDLYVDVCAKIPAYEINVTQCERVDCIWSMDPVEIRDFELRVVDCSICGGDLYARR